MAELFRSNTLFMLSMKKFRYLKYAKMQTFTDNPNNNRIFRGNRNLELCSFSPMKKVENVENINSNKSL